MAVNFIFSAAICHHITMQKYKNFANVVTTEIQFLPLICAHTVCCTYMLEELCQRHCFFTLMLDTKLLFFFKRAGMLHFILSLCG